MLARIEKFGSKARVRNVLESMRTEQCYGKRKRDDEAAEETTRKDDEGKDVIFEDEAKPDPGPVEERAVLDDDLKQRIAAKREAALALRRQRQLEKTAATTEG